MLKCFCLIRQYDMSSREKNIKSITAQTKKITKEPAKTDELNQIYLDQYHISMASICNLFCLTHVSLE